MEFRSQIRLDLTPDGLRIQIVDEQSRPMFDLGGAVVKDYMREILREIGKVLNGVDHRDQPRRATPTPRRTPAASAATRTGSSPATVPTPRAGN